MVIWLQANEYEVEGAGTYSEDSVDYPDYAHKVAKKVSESRETVGVLICGTGNGVCMTANKHDNVRAGLVWNPEIAELIRLHNDANVICLPARYLSFKKTIDCLEVFLKTPFEAGRHARRIEKIPTVD